MRIFVTGGTGFIGRWLVPLLAERGHKLLILTRYQPLVKDSNNIRYLRGDLRDIVRLKDMLKDFCPETMIHLAWEGLPDYSLEMCKRNLEHGLNMFSLAVKTGCSCILSTGSCWEYECRSGQLKENDTLNTTAIFSAVKNSLRFVGEAIAKENGIKFYWLRLFFVYGPGQRLGSLIPHIIEFAKNGLAPQIKSPHNRNDFVFVKDVARAIADILKVQPGNTIYNIGSGHPTAVEDIAQIAYGVLNKTFNRSSFPDQTYIVQNFWADISRISHDIGWRPEYDIESGIKATLENLKVGN